MDELLETDIACPYCGEVIGVSIEVLEEPQEYIEDCQVCCQPIVFHVGGELDDLAIVTVHAENETF